MTEIDWLAHLGDVSTGALLVLLFLMLATGRIVTRREADGYKADRDTWRDVALKEQEARGKQDALMEKLTEQGKTMLAMLESIRRESDKESGRREGQ